MLDSIEPRQFDEWIAENSIEPWGDECRNVSRLQTAIVNAGLTIYAGVMGSAIKESDLLDDEAYVPGNEKAPSNNRHLSASESESRAKARHG